MVLLINVSDFPVSFPTDADDISWPITGLQFMTEKENEWTIRFDDFFSCHKYDFWRFCAKKKTKKFVVAFTTDTDDISWLKKK